MGTGSERMGMSLPASMTTWAWAQRVGAVVFVGCLSLFGVVWWSTGAPTAWPKLADDAFYYFQVAENAANGHLLSVDQLHFTNGFQPLWLLVLFGFYSLHPSPLVVAPACIAILQILLLAMSTVALVDLAERLTGRTSALLAACLLLFPRFLNVALCGLEGGLVVLLTLLVLRTLMLQPEWLRPKPGWSDAVTGLWLGLLMLARLDAVWLLLAVAAAVGLRGALADDVPVPERALRIVLKGLAIFWPVVLLVVPHLAWNQLKTGHVVPISGVLKSSFPQVHWNGRYLLEHKEYYALTLLIGLAALRVRDATEPVRWTLRVVALGVGVHALYTLLFMHWAVFGWHYAMSIAAGPFALAWLTRSLAVRPRWLQSAFLAFTSLTMVSLIGYSLLKRETNFVPWSLAGGDWARTNLPHDAILAMKDSGAFTYQSRRRVVNLDGVINGYPYQQALCRGEIAEFLQRAGVTYIVQHAVPVGAATGAFVQYYPCHLAGGQASHLTLHADDVLFRGAPYGPDLQDQLVIWRAPWSHPEP